MDLNSAEQRKYRENLKPVPLPEYDGMAFPSFFSFRKKGAETVINNIIDFQSRESDILICAYPKSGTHWIHEIIHMLESNTTVLCDDSKSLMLEMIEDLSDLDQQPSPRMLNTHCSFRHLPRRHIENKGKIVHIVRNPKDVCVSLHHHSKKDVFIYLNISWMEYFEIWMSGKLPYGSWYDYELEMEAAEKENPGLIYTCYYEDIKKNPEKEIKKLANFLEVKCSDETIKNIADATTFNNMKKNKIDITKAFYGEGFMYRKGQIGDWKNHFTVSQNDRFETQYEQRMKSSHYKFDFE